MPTRNVVSLLRTERTALLTIGLAATQFAVTGSAACLALPFALLLAVVLWRDWRFGYWVLLASIPVSVQVSLAGGLLSTTVPDEPLMWGFLLLALLFCAARPRAWPGWLLRHPLTLIVALQLVWLLVAVCCSRVPLLSVKHLAAKLWFLAAFFVMPALILRNRRALRAAFLLPALAAIVAVTIRHAALGFRFDEVGAAMGFLFQNHVEYASLISLLFPLLCVAWPLCSSRWRPWLWAAILVFVLALLVSYSRAAVMALFFAGLVRVLVRRSRAGWLLPVGYAFIGLMMAFLIHKDRFMALQPDYEHTYMHQDFAGHMIATVRGQDLSSMERLYRWIAAVRMSREEPLTGFGPHAFYHFYKPYALGAFRTYTSDNPERSTTHNYLLLMLTEQGWPGMLLYALLMAVAVANGQATYHRLRDPVYKAAAMGAIMMLAVSFVNNFFSELIESHKTGSLFYLSLYVLVLLDRKSRLPANSSNTAPDRFT